MSTTSKSPRTVLLVAFEVATRSLPAHAHRCSPKKFTQHQLFACLVLKELLKLDYRGLSAALADCDEWRQAIGLEFVPHFTTLHKAAGRLLRAAANTKLLDQVVRDAVDARLCPRRGTAAIDGTGLESRHTSPYFIRRRSRGDKTVQTMTYSRFPQAVLLCDCESHLILSAVAGRGPGSELPQLIPAFEQARRRVSLSVLLADADYDAEKSHEHARSHGVRTLIPPLRGRPSQRGPRSRWRRLIWHQLKRQRLRRQYGQRWQSETTHSMLKRLLGPALRARSYWTQCREINLRVLTLDIMILLCPVTSFLQSTSDPFYSSDLYSLLFFFSFTPRRQAQRVRPAAPRPRCTLGPT